MNRIKNVHFRGRLWQAGRDLEQAGGDLEQAGGDLEQAGGDLEIMKTWQQSWKKVRGEE